MTTIFISYSSLDSTFIMKLVRDLKKTGCDIWLDKWEIKVGDDIFDKIQCGIKNAEFVVLVLSNNSISSGWVDKEWKIAYWSEITSRRVKVLPVLLEDCEIPDFVKLKKYADFRKSYDTALQELITSIKSEDISSIRKESISESPLTGLSRFDLFKKVYNYAYSISGMNMAAPAARQFRQE